MARSRRALFVVILGLSASSLVQSSSTQTPQAGQTGTPPLPQENRPQFRAGVELVQLDVSVLDRDRRPVAGLTAADFQLLENGKPRPIRGFTAVHLPAQAAGVAAVPANAPPRDVVTNRAGLEDGRLVVILMDRTIPPGEPTLAARKIAAAAINTLGPNDLGALVSSSGAVPQNLTVNRSRLLEALDQRDWSTGLSKAQEDVAGKEDPLSDGRCLCGLCVMETVTRVAEALQHAPRRHKMLLFIGSRVIFQAGPRTPTADVGCGQRLVETRERMQASLALSHLTVHSLDPTGLSSIGPHTRASAPGGKPGEARLARVQQTQVETAELLEQQGSLRYLPDLTGGRTVANTNAPEEAVPEIFAESASYYVLGFESAAADRSGNAPVEVKVSPPGARVFAQRRYQLQPSLPGVLAPGGTAQPAPVLAALRGLLPVATRPLTISAAAFAGPEARATVVVNVDVGAFAEGAAARPLRFALSVFDQGRREIKSSTQTATVAFNNSTDTNVQTTVELPPGNYEVRMAVEHEKTAVASVFAPLSVPRFDRAPLSLSDVIVQTSAKPSAAPGEITLSPTTRRMFSRAEQVRAVFEVYQGTGSSASISPVSVRNRIVDSSGRAIREQRLDLAAKSFTHRKAGMSVDLSALPAGEYVLTIDAELDRESANRAIPFAVR